MRLWKGIHCRRRIISVSDAAFPLFLTAFLSFPDPVRDLVRPRKTVRIREAFLFLMGKQPLPIGPDVESVVNGSLRKRIHRTAHISALPCVGEEPVLPFQLFREGSRAAGILMKIIRTARLNQVDSEKYIAYVLTQLGKTGQEDIDRLLPWSESLPKKVRSSKYEVPKNAVDSIKKDKYE